MTTLEDNTTATQTTEVATEVATVATEDMATETPTEQESPKGSTNKATSEAAQTPLMRQYNSIKQQYPDALLLFRAGDFYETFGDDAVTASGILGITLTKRANGAAASIPLAGFPHHALDVYLPKLVQAGQRVAICEQLEDPKLAKGIVKRGVTELVTPGVSYNDNVLERRENTFLAAVCYRKESTAGLALLDVSTGEFYAAEGKLDYIEKILSNLPPKEMLYNPDQGHIYSEHLKDQYYSYKLDPWAWNTPSNKEKLERHFGVHSLKGYGLDDSGLAITAAGAILHYLEYTRHTDLNHVRTLSRLDPDSFVLVDKYTTRNLELFAPLNPDGVSLYDVLDKTHTPTGARNLRRWIALPLRSVDDINQRLDAVSILLEKSQLRSNIELDLTQVGDPERLAGKISASRINPREIMQLARSLESINSIKNHITDVETLKPIYNDIDPCGELYHKIKTTITENPAIMVGKGAIIASNVNEELDELRELSRNGKEYLVEITTRESTRTGISSLKIGYNNVFGYYIEVRNTHKDKVPEEWIRKQTLVNAERYITEELKEYEEKILGAEEKISQIETAILTEVVDYMRDFVSNILTTSAAIAKLDTLISFAKVSLDNNYCRAELTTTNVMNVKEGRHPVIEQCLPLGESYIPNDLYLDSETQQIIIITGPNMAGKSALLRQTALITLMAQIGCFVPAKSASLGVVDRIFTRVGASDNISKGESTFMVEMLESANILNNITEHSLVLLDEIGRGTSTYDGVSIAWAMVEYLHHFPGARTLFATHYHELNELENQFDRIKNYNVAIKEIEGKIIFLRKLVQGGTEHSFGIHVAKLAGMPKGVIARSEEILKQLEKNRDGASDNQSDNKKTVKGKKDMPSHQLSFFQLDDPTITAIRSEIEALEIDELSPRDALDKLYEIKRMCGAKK